MDTQLTKINLQVTEANDQERKAKARADAAEVERDEAQERADTAVSSAGSDDDARDQNREDHDDSDAGSGDAQGQEARRREEPEPRSPDAEDVRMMDSGVTLLDPNRPDPDSEIGAPPPEPRAGMSWFDVGMASANHMMVGPADQGDDDDTTPDTRPGGDPDGDGVQNLVDTDDDGDGIPDVRDAYPFEADAEAIVIIRRPTHRPQVQPVAPPAPEPRRAARERRHPNRCWCWGVRSAGTLGRTWSARRRLPPAGAGRRRRTSGPGAPFLIGPAGWRQVSVAIPADRRRCPASPR